MSCFELIKLSSLNKVTFNGKIIDCKSIRPSACLGSKSHRGLHYILRVWSIRDQKEPPLVDLLEEVQN